MTKFLKLYLTVLALFVSIDFVWLATMNNFYKKYLGHLMAGTIQWPGVLLFYPLFVAGLVLFVLNNYYSATATITTVAVLGAFFGLVTYGTYDLTNYATLNRWPFHIVVIDMAWGALLSGAVSVLATLLIKR